MKQIRTPVVAAVVIHHHESLPLVQVRHFQRRNPGIFGGIGQFIGEVLPGGAAIAGELHLTIIGAHPYHIFLKWRRVNGYDRTMIFGIGGIGGQSAGNILVHFGCIIGSQVGTDDAPGLSEVFRVMHKLRTEVYAMWSEGVLCQCSVPVEAQFGYTVGMQRLDIPAVACFAVTMAEFATLRL